MRKRNRILLGMAGLAIVGWLAWEILRPHEPEYKGRRLSEWLDDYNRAKDQDQEKPISEAIYAMGTNCEPFLLANLEHAETPLKTMFYNFVRNESFIRLPFYRADPSPPA